MTEIELLQRMGLAIAIGLLIGVERGWQEREAHDGARVAGIRTFTLISMLGALSGLAGGTEAPAILGYCFVGFALPFGWFEWRHARVTGNRSATDLVAGLLTFLLGAYAARGNLAVAGAAGVTTTVILAERRFMHAFLRRLRWVELRGAIMLLVMTAVLLPLLPDRTVDPWNAINPHQIWLMTVLIGIISYAGYIAIRLAGEREGLLYAGLMGGLVTSTTVTWTFARLVKRDAGSLPAVLTAVLGAWIVSLVRMTAIAISIAPQLALHLIPPVSAAALVLLIPAVAGFLKSRKVSPPQLVIRDPVELPLMLQFTAILTVIMLLAKLASAFQGHAGILSLGGISGLLDVDPITLSMADLTRTAAAPAAVAAATILTAAAANGLAKAVLAIIFGGARLGGTLAFLLIAAVGAGALAYLQ
jgi:uncharacterized membrane protein (DUF4010 family)